MEKSCLFLPKISSYIDNELSERERLEVETHLDGCRECRKELEKMKAVDELISALPEIEPRHGFDSEFARKLEDLETPERTFQAFFKSQWRYALASAAALLIGIGCILYNYMPSKAPSVYEMQLAANLELLQDLEIIENLDLLEHMDELQVLGNI